MKLLCSPIKQKYRINCCFLMLLLAINITATSSESINTTDSISDAQHSFTSQLGIERVLSRKKRYLLFPPGAAFVATMSFAKAIATDNPRGVNFVVETDFYYPLYSTIEELFPKKTTTPATTKKPATTPIPLAPMTMEEDHEFDSIPDTYFNESNVWRRKDWSPYRGYNNKEYIPLHPNYLNWKSPKPYYKPWHRPYTNYITRPIYNTPKTYSSDVIYPNKYRDGNWKQRDVIYPNKYRDGDWKQRELYRSRRDLYSHIEAMAEKHGFEIQTCIHRMICEGRHYLLPPGASFFQDVLRILFTLPVSNDFEDGYSKAMGASENECMTEYSEKCPYSIIGYLIHNQLEQNK